MCGSVWIFLAGKNEFQRKWRHYPIRTKLKSWADFAFGCYFPQDYDRLSSLTSAWLFCRMDSPDELSSNAKFTATESSEETKPMCDINLFLSCHDWQVHLVGFRGQGTEVEPDSRGSARTQVWDCFRDMNTHTSFLLSHLGFRATWVTFSHLPLTCFSEPVRSFLKYSSISLVKPLLRH